MTHDRCPCLSGLTYDECCARPHQGDHAATAEDLMRARFSAFALGDVGYLLRTWHPSTRPSPLTLDAGTRWYRLDVVATVRGGADDDDGTVEFRAFYRAPDGAGAQHEVSRFVRSTDRDRSWVYVDGY